MFSKPRINIFVSKYNSQFGIFINDPYYLSLRHYIPPNYLRDKNDIECCKVIITTLEHRDGIRISRDPYIIEANEYYEKYFS